MSDPSYWFEDIPDEKRFPSLEGDLHVDVAIIGGGIAGISASYFLSRSGMKAALLEAGNLVTGDSGYTTAFATHFLDSISATINAWQASEKGLLLFREIIAKENISCDWQEVAGIEFTQKASTDGLKKDFEAYQSIDPTVEYLEGDSASALLGLHVNAAFRKKEGEGQFHIRKFLLGLADRAVKNGAGFWEGSEVIAMEHSAPLKLHTKNGTVTADWLVVASGPPPRQFFPQIFDTLTGAITYVIQAHYPETKPFIPALLWDDLEPYHYFRWVNDTDLILGGEDRYLKEKALDTHPHEALAQWLKEISKNVLFQVVNKWQGTIFFTPNILPYIGPHEAYGNNIVFLTGWGGNGMVHGLLAGQIAADLIQRKKNQFEDLFSFNRIKNYGQNK